MGIMSNIMQNARFVGGENRNVAAAGSAQADAAFIGGAVNEISDVTEGSALRIPSDRVMGDLLFVTNKSGGGVSVFPSEGGIIVGLAENAALSVADGKSVLFISLGPNRWGSITSA